MIKNKTATEIMIKQRESDYQASITALIDQPYITVGNFGARIDVLGLIDSLPKKKRNEIVKYIVHKYGFEN